MGSPATTTAAPPPRAGSLYDAYLSELFPATNSAHSQKGDGGDDVNDEEGDGLNVTKLDDDDALLPACNYFGHYPPPPPMTLASHTNSNALSRNVCIITTAALPWRTGTAVNPLLRALHLIRYRGREQQNANNSAAATNINRSNANGNNNDNSNNSNNNSGGGKVALVIPWLISKDERIQLYGEQNSFSNDDEDDNEENEKDENENDNQVTNPQRPNYSSSSNNNNDNSNKSSSSSSSAASSSSSSSSSSSGMAKQEAWIRHYSATACQMPLESQLLTILFYPAFYQANFGSIFPKVDLCNYIPHELVDVAILEEPEHLNWFRMPYYHNNDDEDYREENDEDDGIIDDDDDGDGGIGEDDDNAADANDDDDDDDDDDDRRKAEELGLITHRGGGEISKKFVQSMVSATTSKARRQRPARNNNNNLNKLGWTHRFRYVVGIVHTNYEEYARQYGIGVSLLAAPAVGAISALNIRAHCHKVIKLSDTLPNFAPGKECTCNVHGVRSEFYEDVDMSAMTPSSPSKPTSNDDDDEDNKEYVSSIYFIGKLVWAKGFDMMLDVQDIYRKKHGTYFPIDIYGGGPDERAIARAFHGRNHTLGPMIRPALSSPSMRASSSMTKISSAGDMKAAAILANPQSLKEQLERQRSDHQRTMSLTMMPEDGYGIDDVVSQYASLGFEVSQINGSATYVLESRSPGEVQSATTGGGRGGGGKGGGDDGTATSGNPLHILGELSGKGLDTGIRTTQAVYNIADSSIKNILTMSFSQLKKQKLSLKDTMRRAKEKISEIPDPKSSTIHGTPTITTARKAAMSSPTTNNEGAPNSDGRGSKGKDGYEIAVEDENEESSTTKPHFVFDPPASRYEWRRTPIPAKFPGVVDHAALKNTVHYIFLNPSTSEVLCTTTAEALAMNKFVIIPKHPSNDFFMQFTNCLSYTTLEECADQVAYALATIPTVLTNDERRKFTWEAATERLIESSIITIKEARERTENGMDRTDARIAYWLSESGEKSNMIRSLFPKG